MTENDFRLVLSWFRAGSGSKQKADIADEIKAKLPGVEPWTWVNAFVDYLKPKQH